MRIWILKESARVDEDIKSSVKKYISRGFKTQKQVASKKAWSTNDKFLSSGGAKKHDRNFNRYFELSRGRKPKAERG